MAQRIERITADGRKKVIALLFKDHVAVNACAARFGVSRMTILRIRQEYYLSLDDRKNEEARDTFDKQQRN